MLVRFDSSLALHIFEITAGEVLPHSGTQGKKAITLYGACTSPTSACGRYYGCSVILQEAYLPVQANL